MRLSRRHPSRRALAAVDRTLVTTLVTMFAGVAIGCASGGGGGGAAAVEQSRTIVSTPSSGAPDLELYRDTRLVAHSVKAPPAEVWKAMPAAYADLGLVGGPARGQTQTFAAVLPSIRRQLDKVPLSKLLDCGTTPTGTPSADVHLVRLQVTTIVEPEGATGTRLRTQVLARATSVENSNGAQECSSTGILEQRLAQAVDARVGAP
jgi:hypothetical protein